VHSSPAKWDQRKKNKKEEERGEDAKNREKLSFLEGYT
jgi:hypothetical protein